MASANKLSNMFNEQAAEDVEYRFPVTAEIISHDGSSATIVIPSFDMDAKFGPIPYIHAALGAGSTVLAVRDENDDWWILAP